MKVCRLRTIACEQENRAQCEFETMLPWHSAVPGNREKKLIKEVLKLAWKGDEKEIGILVQIAISARQAPVLICNFSVIRHHRLSVQSLSSPNQSFFTSLEVRARKRVVFRAPASDTLEPSLKNDPDTCLLYTSDAADES